MLATNILLVLVLGTLWAKWYPELLFTVIKWAVVVAVVCVLGWLVLKGVQLYVMFSN